VPDRAIQLTTNSPVNHVGMAVVIDDLPPLMWHAELGRSLPDMWSGTHHRGVQLHDLRDAVTVWARRYSQRAWLRQLDPQADAAMEDAVLRTVARLDGTPFPSTAQLAWRWLRGRVPVVPPAARLPAIRRFAAQLREQVRSSGPDTPPEQVERTKGQLRGRTAPELESVYCAEVVAVTYEAMGLLTPGRRTNWYDPGRFWSGDELRLRGDARLGREIPVEVPPGAAARERTAGPRQ